jgi:hypothetical protein
VATDLFGLVVHGENHADHLRGAMQTSMPEFVIEHDDRRR